MPDTPSLRLLVANGRTPWPFFVGGDGTILHDLLVGLGGRGVACSHLGCAPSLGALDRGLLARQGVTAQLRKDGLRYSAPYPARVVEPPGFVPTLAHLLAHDPPDVVWTQLDRAAEVAGQALDAGIPVVRYVVDVNHPENLRGLEEQPGVQILAISRFVQGVLAGRQLAAEVLLPAIETAAYAVRRAGGEEGAVTFINPVPVKGRQVALALARRLPEQRFLFVEGWPLTAGDRAALAGLENVELLPRQLDMRTVYRQTRLLLVPSQWQEAFGRVVIEAQASGIPVVASHIGGLPEAVGPGGVLVWDPSNPDAWVEAIAPVLEDPAVYQRLSQAARDHAGSFELDDRLDQAEELLRRVAAQPPPLRHGGPPTAAEKVLSLIRYNARASDTWFDAGEFEAGYHGFTLEDRHFAGQREAADRLRHVPFDFTDRTVLDLGCNQGGLLFALQDRLRYGVGVDHNPRLVNVANRLGAARKAGNLDFYHFDLDTDPLEHLPDFLRQGDDRVDMCFLLAVCRWLKRWPVVIDAALERAPRLLFETNGSPQEQFQQVEHLAGRCVELQVLRVASLEDAKQPYRSLLLGLAGEDMEAQVPGGYCHLPRERNGRYRVFRSGDGQRVLKRIDLKSNLGRELFNRVQRAFTEYREALDARNAPHLLPLRPHIVAVGAIGEDGSYETAFVEGPDLADTPTLEGLDDKKRARLAQAIRTLAEQLLQVPQLDGDWMVHNLVFDRATGAVVNVDLEGFFTYRHVRTPHAHELTHEVVLQDLSQVHRLLTDRPLELSPRTLPDGPARVARLKATYASMVQALNSGAPFSEKSRISDLATDVWRQLRDATGALARLGAIPRPKGRRLVFSSVGAHSRHQGWLSDPEHKRFDLFLCGYDPEASRYAEQADRYVQREGLKWPNFLHCYRANPGYFDGYDAIWIVDDDIEMGTEAVSRLFDVFLHHRLWLAQPAFTEHSFISHPICRMQPNQLLRYTNFVECNAPLLSVDALKRLLPLIGEAGSGCGLDYAMVQALGEPREEVAVIDALPATHRYRLTPFSDKSGWMLDECRHFVERYRIPTLGTMPSGWPVYPYKTFGHIPPGAC